jgi:hypothetical protein
MEWGQGLRKEYVITEISAAPDGSPYVLVAFKSPEEAGGSQRPPVTPIESFPSMDAVFQNLGSIISKQMMGGFATVIRLSLDEYEKLDIKVGDRISLDINKIPVGLP